MDYQKRQQANYNLTANYSIRQPVYETSPHRIFVKNTEAEVIPPYACMRVTGVELVGDRTCLTVEKPSKLDGEFLFNSQFEIPVEDEENDVFAVGWAYRYGTVLMLGDVPADFGTRYRPAVDSWEIDEGGGPFEVYGRHCDGDRALIGRIVGSEPLYCKLDGALAAAASGTYSTSSRPSATASIWIDDGASGLVDSTRNITVVNRHDIAHDSATFGNAAWISGAMQFFGQCAPF